VLSPLVWRRMMSEAWQARLIGWTSPCWAVGSAVLLQRSPSRGTGVASSSSSVMVRRVAGRRAREDITGAVLDLGARPPLERRSECGLLYYVFRGPDVRRPLELPDWSALSQP
jgi:hypothetical protein